MRIKCKIASIDDINTNRLAVISLSSAEVNANNEIILVSALGDAFISNKRYSDDAVLYIINNLAEDGYYKCEDLFLRREVKTC